MEEIPICMDVTADADIKREIDAFINNAGGSARSNNKVFWEQDIEVIVNMASVVGMNGKEKMTDYAAAKSGIIDFTKSLALELGKYNIRVNCVSTGMVSQISFDAGLPIRGTNINCLGKFGYTDNVADLVAFIVSGEANILQDIISL